MKQESAMLFTNACIENKTTLQDIRIRNGLFLEIGTKLLPEQGETVTDLGGRLVLPPFIESHVHLDACLTAGDPVWNQSGTLFEGIECWAKRKSKLNKADIRERVIRAVRMYAAHGIQYIRTHVDVTDPSLLALETMLELREELKDFVEIQIVAFPQEGIFSYPDGRRLMQEAVRMGADAVGAIPHFEFTREYSVESLNFALQLAAEHGLLVDVHCDEIDDEASRGLEIGSYDRTRSFAELDEAGLRMGDELGLGVCYKIGDRFLAEFDYIRSNWANSRMDQLSGFSNEGDVSFAPAVGQAFRAGMEFTPNRSDIRYYFRRCTYRVGAYFDQSYYTVDGAHVNAVGVTLGMTLPVFRWYNGISLGVDLGRRGLAASQVKENYFGFSVGFNVFDIWFQKRPYE